MSESATGPKHLGRRPLHSQAHLTLYPAGSLCPPGALGYTRRFWGFTLAFLWDHSLEVPCSSLSESVWFQCLLQFSVYLPWEVV